MAFTYSTGSYGSSNQKIGAVAESSLVTFTRELVDLESRGWKMRGGLTHDGTNYVAILQYSVPVVDRENTPLLLDSRAL